MQAQRQQQLRLAVAEVELEVRAAWVRGAGTGRKVEEPGVSLQGDPWEVAPRGEDLSEEMVLLIHSNT